jgi:hypothetical protein
MGKNTRASSFRIKGTDMVSSFGRMAGITRAAGLMESSMATVSSGRPMAAFCVASGKMGSA